MSVEISDAVELLSYKLSDLMSELYTIHTGEEFIKDENDKPWSSDMSGPYKYAVWNNDTFVISEVANPQLASGIAGGRDPVDAGENIKLYVNDVTTRKKLSSWGVCPVTIRTYTKSCICASSWIAESGANYILRTANNGEDTNVTKSSEGEDALFAPYSEQRTAMMDVFLRLARFEQISFGPGSNQEDHPTFAKVLTNKDKDDPVNALFLGVIEKYRKKRREAAPSSSMNDGATAENKADKDETDLKGQAAKQRRNQRKYSRKKAKKQKNITVLGKEDQDETKTAEVEVEEKKLHEENIGEVDVAQLDTCRELWRKIMDEPPRKINGEGKECRHGSENEGVEAKVSELYGNRPQDPHRPGILDLQTPVSWKQAKRDFQDLMAQYGLEHITFIGDKLKSGECKKGDGLEPFYNQFAPDHVN